MKTLAIALFALSLLTSQAQARGNTACSGKKGGVSHCSGSKFVCKDGTISRSKKICGS